MFFLKYRKLHNDGGDEGSDDHSLLSKSKGTSKMRIPMTTTKGGCEQQEVPGVMKSSSSVLKFVFCGSRKSHNIDIDNHVEEANDHNNIGLMMMKAKQGRPKMTTTIPMTTKGMGESSVLGSNTSNFSWGESGTLREVSSGGADKENYISFDGNDDDGDDVSHLRQQPQQVQSPGKVLSKRAFGGSGTNSYHQLSHKDPNISWETYSTVSVSWDEGSRIDKEEYCNGEDDTSRRHHHHHYPELQSSVKKVSSSSKQKLRSSSKQGRPPSRQQQSEDGDDDTNISLGTYTFLFSLNHISFNTIGLEKLLTAVKKRTQPQASRNSGNKPKEEEEGTSSTDVILALIYGSDYNTDEAVRLRHYFSRLLCNIDDNDNTGIDYHKKLDDSNNGLANRAYYDKNHMLHLQQDDEEDEFLSLFQYSNCDDDDHHHHDDDDHSHDCSCNPSQDDDANDDDDDDEHGLRGSNFGVLHLKALQVLSTALEAAIYPSSPSSSCGGSVSNDENDDEDDSTSASTFTSFRNHTECSTTTYPTVLSTQYPFCPSTSFGSAATTIKTTSDYQFCPSTSFGSAATTIKTTSDSSIGCCPIISIDSAPPTAISRTKEVDPITKGPIDFKKDHGFWIKIVDTLRYNIETIPFDDTNVAWHSLKILRLLQILEPIVVGQMVQLSLMPYLMNLQHYGRQRHHIGIEMESTTILRNLNFVEGLCSDRLLI